MTFGNLTVKKLNEVQQNTPEIKPNIKVYLFVPYKYKDEVKRKGAKFDWLNKTWYIYDNHPDREELEYIYNQKNIQEYSSGWKKTKEKTDKRIDEVIKTNQLFDELKIQWVQDGKE